MFVNTRLHSKMTKANKTKYLLARKEENITVEVRTTLTESTDQPEEAAERLSSALHYWTTAFFTPLNLRSQSEHCTSAGGTSAAWSSGCLREAMTHSISQSVITLYCRKQDPGAAPPLMMGEELSISRKACAPQYGVGERRGSGKQWYLHL